eukprot:187794-Alexandrium_andersonii.AAC.1
MNRRLASWPRPRTRGRPKRARHAGQAAAVSWPKPSTRRRRAVGAEEQHKHNDEHTTRTHARQRDL